MKSKNYLFQPSYGLRKKFLKVKKIPGNSSQIQGVKNTRSRISDPRSGSATQMSVYLLYIGTGRQDNFFLLRQTTVKNHTFS
jgi:hypothetical protein